MKVGNVNLTSSTVNTNLKDNHKIKKSQAGAFSDTLGGFEKENEKQQLEKKLKDINEKGKNVKDKMELPELVEYKQMIKDFLEYTVKYSYKYSKETKFGKDGSYKVMGIVQKVNDEMELLTEELVVSQKDKLKIVEKISGIQGMLMDLIM